LRLLNPREFRTLIDTEKDIEVKESYQRRQKILTEIAEFNRQRDTLEKGTKLLEEEFERFANEMLAKQKVLIEEIKILEAKKNNLK